MANGYTKAGENIYFRCRKEAAIYDERLSSREGASELLGISPSSLADYELGNTKIVPVDKVDAMAELYNAPHIRSMYCKHECPLGANLPLATEIRTIENITVRLVGSLDENRISEVKKRLLAIAGDGKIDEYDVPILEEIVKYLAELQEVISELGMICDKENIV